MNMPETHESFPAMPKRAFEYDAATEAISGKLYTLLNEYGVVDSFDGDCSSLEWTHPSDGLKIMLQSGTFWGRHSNLLSVYSKVTLIALNEEDVDKGTVMELTFDYPFQHNKPETTIMYREFEGQRRYNGFMQQEEWMTRPTEPISRSPVVGGLGWFEVGLSLMETDLASKKGQ